MCVIMSCKDGVSELVMYSRKTVKGKASLKETGFVDQDTLITELDTLFLEDGQLAVVLSTSLAFATPFSEKSADEVV